MEKENKEATKRRRAKKAPSNAAKTKTPARGDDEVVIITGLSGSGKGSVLKVFEDMGFYAVDNLPIALIPTFAELFGH